MRKVRCRCDCGNETSVMLTNLKTGKTSSCGCNLPRKHGYGKTPTYRSWYSMRDRCNNSRHVKYRLYGGRGVKVCERWNTDFLNFLADMGERPPGTSIDRINGDGDYEPGNCRWASSKTQATNVRPSLLDENGTRISKPRAPKVCEWYGGDPMTIEEAVAKYRVTRQRLYQLKRERAAKASRKERKEQRERNGVTHNEIAAKQARSFIFGKFLKNT